jgi:inorganic pyrophosphatase
MSINSKKTFDVLIEIPKGSRNKYEYDFVLHKIRFDRMLFSSMMYPGDYGFIPETLALDKDPLDVLVLGSEPTFPMCVMEVKPIGVFHMTDEKGPDEKIICVPVSDPIWNLVEDISDMNQHQLKEMKLARLLIIVQNGMNLANIKKTEHLLYKLLKICRNF